MIHMAHITLSIPDELYKEMKKHSDIKWSEAARRGIINKLVEIRGVVPGKEIFDSLPESTRDMISKLKYSKEDWNSWNRKMREKDKKRVMY